MDTVAGEVTFIYEIYGSAIAPVGKKGLMLQNIRPFSLAWTAQFRSDLRATDDPDRQGTLMHDLFRYAAQHHLAKSLLPV